MINSDSDLVKSIADRESGSLTVIAARPGFGKSQLAFRLANELALTLNKDLKVFNLDPSRVWDEVRTRQHPPVTIHEEFECCQSVFVEENLMKDAVIVIDTLQMVDYGETGSFWDSACRSIQELNLSNRAREIHSHIFLISNLGRGIEDNPDGKPLICGNSNRYDDQLCQCLLDNADMVLLLWRKHKCYREIGVAHAYDFEGKAEVAVYSKCGFEGLIKE